MARGIAASFGTARTTMQTLGSATAPELADHMGIGRGTAQELLDALVLEGMVRSNGVRRGQRGRPPYIYEFIRPRVEPGQKSSHPTQAPPEKVVVAQFGKLHNRRQNGQHRSGRAMRTGSGIVDGLIREVRKQGVEVRKTAHKVEYLKDGRVIANSSKTPGASSLKQTRSELRKAGIAA